MADETGQYDYSEVAGNYDEQVRAYDSYAHDVIFGMGFEFVTAGQRLLDIGIGTGLASIPFARVGLQVYGLDSSPPMLEACRARSFAAELQHHEIGSGPLPYDDGFFHHVICCGVLHFLGDLAPLVAEVARVTRSGSIFAFTFAPLESGERFGKEDTAWGVPIYKHSPDYVLELLEANGFAAAKQQRLLTKGADKTTHNMLFSTLVARRGDAAAAG